jgi:hypothetical protein
MLLRYRLSTLVNWMVLICFLLWICRLDAGAELLGGIGAWLIAGMLFVGLVWLVSFLYGIPGERQRKRAEMSAKSPIIDR